MERVYAEEVSDVRCGCGRPSLAEALAAVASGALVRALFWRDDSEIRLVCGMAREGLAVGELAIAEDVRARLEQRCAAAWSGHDAEVIRMLGDRDLLALAALAAVALRQARLADEREKEMRG